MGRHRRRKGHARTGLIGASAALTVSAVAVGTGLLPGSGPDRFLTEAGDGPVFDPGQASSSGSPTTSPTMERGGVAGNAEETATTPAEESSSAAPAPTQESERSEEPAERRTETTAEEEPAEATSEPEPSSEPEPTNTPSADPAESAEPTEEAEPTQEPSQEPTGEPTEEPTPEEDPEPTADPETEAALAVLERVNQERAAVGCMPLTLDAGLTGLATGHSRDMAERGFFSHTDPDGLDPWARAELAGIISLGGENIARGQQDAQAVMDAWMNSEGHRDNILNCQFTTLGVGVHLGEGGPWWTQTFGY